MLEIGKIHNSFYINLLHYFIMIVIHVYLFRFVNPDMDKKVFGDYFYNVSTLKGIISFDNHRYFCLSYFNIGSGEYALNKILDTSAFGRSPLCLRLPQLIVPVTFIYGDSGFYTILFTVFVIYIIFIYIRLDGSNTC